MLSINNIAPEPLQGHFANSEIWQATQQFQKGTWYNVQATSGKGKSTLLHILYGLRWDYKGKVAIDGKAITALAMEDWATLRQNSLSIVFQDLRLFPDLTAMDNILVKSMLTKHKSETEICLMAERLGVSHLLAKLSGELSYGQRQRVAIIRALCQPFDFLLLDEPFSHLDEGNAQAAADLIAEECKAQGAGLILCSLEPSSSFEFDKTLDL